MADLKLNSSGGGSVTLTTPSTASNLTLTLPAATSTLLDTTSTQTLTNKTLTAAGSNTVEATSGPTSTQLAGNRNKIINGAMMIDQRNAGAATTLIPSQTYNVDRWLANEETDGSMTVQQSTTAPAGFINSLLFTTTSADSSLGSTQNVYTLQKIEGLNIADLGWGTVSAATVTLSFWVRSSLTGTFGGAVTNGAFNRSYPFSYTISSANTWEQKTVTIAGDTSGTWLTTNSVGIQLIFGLGVGSAYSGTAGSWAGAGYISSTGATSVIGTNGATFYITGVQLEKGATATPFENRLYGTELALCQRYYRQTGISGSNTEGSIYGYGVATTGFIGQSIPYPVPMRAAPTASYAGTWVRVNATGGLQAFSDSYLPFLTPTGTGTTQQYSNGSGYITFSAEL